jgi:hypothetical protein
MRLSFSDMALLIIETQAPCFDNNIPNSYRDFNGLQEINAPTAFYGLSLAPRAADCRIRSDGNNPQSPAAN